MCKVTVQVHEGVAAKVDATSVPSKKAASSSNGPSTDEDAYLKQLIPVISAILTHVAERDQSYQLSDKMRPFHSIKIPPISITEYMQRIAKYAYCSPECYIFALVYLDRLVDRVPHCRITPNNVHRLLITSIMVAAKSRDDKYYSNAYYSAVGGVSNSELNKLELAFLSLINFDLNVSLEDCQRYTKELMGNASFVPTN